MRLVVLLALILCPASLRAASNWPSTGFTVIGPSGASELESDGAGFVVGRPGEMNGMGLLTLIDPVGAGPLNLIPAQTGPGAEFGYRVAVSGDLMAVTEARRTMQPPVTTGGVVKFYERAGGVWSMSYLTGSPYEPLAEHEFGRSLAVSGGRVFVGAPGYLLQRGVVWVFEKSGAGTWPALPSGSVFAFDGASFDSFGSSVAADGDWLAVGAPLMEREPGAESEGAVYVFLRTEGAFVQVQRMMAPVPQNFSTFGASVDMGGGWMVVGAPGEDDPAAGFDTGAAYVFELVGDRWEFRQRLAAADPAEGDSFGSQFAIRGDTLVAVATNDDNEFGVNAGTAYVFEREAGAWTETGRIAPAKPPVAINLTTIARLDYVAPDVLVRYYPTTDGIFSGGFED